MNRVADVASFTCLILDGWAWAKSWKYRFVQYKKPRFSCFFVNAGLSQMPLSLCLWQFCSLFFPPRHHIFFAAVGALIQVMHAWTFSMKYTQDLQKLTNSEAKVGKTCSTFFPLIRHTSSSGPRPSSPQLASDSEEDALEHHPAAGRRLCSGQRQWGVCGKGMGVEDSGCIIVLVTQNIRVSVCACMFVRVCDIQVSGLSSWLGSQMTPLHSIPPWAIAVILCLLITVFTECASNVATATLFLPILASMVWRSTHTYGSVAPVVTRWPVLSLCLVS